MPIPSDRQTAISTYTDALCDRIVRVSQNRKLTLKLAIFLCPDDLEQITMAIHGLPVSGQISDTAQGILSLYKGSHPVANLIQQFSSDADDQLLVHYAFSLHQDPVRRSIIQGLHNILSHRYLYQRIHNVKDSSQFYRLLYIIPDRQFRFYARMSRNYFWQIVELIKSHPVFYNKSRKQQEPVELQLLVTLRRLGCYGNASSVRDASNTFGISEGAVIMYTDRCITAILSLKADVVFWPGEEERAEISFRIEAVSGFPLCVGFADGTHVDFEHRPYLDGDSWHSRKERYSMNAFVVVDDLKRIRFAVLGYPGSAHDQRVYSDGSLFTQSDLFFSGKQYILADSAYTSDPHLISAYKRLPNTPLRDDESKFNMALSHIRVKVEHAFGILKAKFMSLRGLRLDIQSVDDVKRVCNWVMACFILHNLVLNEKVDELELEEIVQELRIVEHQHQEFISEDASSGRPGRKSRRVAPSQGELYREALKIRVNNELRRRAEILKI